MKKKDPKNPAKIKVLHKQDLLKQAGKIAKLYSVAEGKKFKLTKYPTHPDLPLGPEEKSIMKEALEKGIATLSHLQEVLYAQDDWSLLIIFQAMDAAGKDGAIKHVMSGINPQGCQVSSFKAPSSEELDHDFLWRCVKRLPERGRIGIFNRSYYEEVLVVRVHEQLLQKQRLPAKLITKKIWDERLEDIRNFEKYLSRNGTKVIKIFLNVSEEEQKARFLERINDPSKNWKLSYDDIKERGYWDEYMHVYEDMIRKTSTKEAPWYVIPADNKTYARLAVASAMVKALEEMELSYPKISEEERARLEELKKFLLEETQKKS
jgi:PPK2 family polyphosphate:nucleotide phosphotransferase